MIAAVGPCEFEPRARGTHFEALARSIISQQLSTKAAATIHGRFQALFPRNAPRASALLELDDETLRSVGLSRQKLGYLRDLSIRANSDEIPLASLGRLSNEAIIEELTRVKGIGTWTVQMFLMFRLGRLDVLPILDLGIQNGVQRAYKMKKRPLPRQVEKLGARWAPYRTLASWYLWRSLDVAGGVP
ncbi:MAG: HhH-GPD family protein [Gemmatimonadetes bacterium]|nr:HhH-GPD family protein [Gemmatimonadota bacterium]